MLSRDVKRRIKKLSYEQVKSQLSDEALNTSSLKGFDSYTKYLIKRYRKLVKKDLRKLPL